MPTTTSDRISIVAKTGRLTQSWASACMSYPYVASACDGRAVVQFAQAAGGDGLAAGEAVQRCGSSRRRHRRCTTTRSRAMPFSMVKTW